MKQPFSYLIHDADGIAQNVIPKPGASPQEQLEFGLYGLQQRIIGCLERGQAVPPVGAFLAEGLQLYKDILNLPVKELARLWGLQPNNLYKYLNGERTLKAKLAAKMALTFDLDPALLLQVVAYHELQACRSGRDEQEYSKAALLKRYGKDQNQQ